MKDIVERRVDGKEYNIPKELKDRPQWVAWRAELKADGKIDKIPINPKTGSEAKTNGSETWNSFDMALELYNRNRSSQSLGGIGYVFTPDDPYTGIDLDDCFNGQLSKWAETIVKQVDSYTEVSPSGRGVKIFLKGKLPKGGRVFKGNGIDAAFYDFGRFFTVTGHVLCHASRDVEDRQDELNRLYRELSAAKVSASPEKPQTVENVVKSLDIDTLPVSNGIKSLIRNGESIGSRSESIMSVVNGLVSKGVSDAAIYQIFEHYPIGEKYREKGAARERWLQQHINKAKNFVTQKQGSSPKVEWFDESCIKNIVPLTTSVDWNSRPEPLPDVIGGGVLKQRGILGIVASAKWGKSTFARQLSLCIAHKTEWLGFPIPKNRRVLILDWENNEEWVEETIKDVAGALGIEKIGNMVILAKMSADVNIDSDSGRKSLVKEVSKQVVNTGAEVVIWDCLSAMNPGKPGANQEVRKALEHSVKLLNENLNISSVILHHYGKQYKKSNFQVEPKYKARDWSGFIDFVDTVINLDEKGSSKGPKTRTMTFVAMRYRRGDDIPPVYLKREEGFIVTVDNDSRKCTPHRVKEILKNEGGRVKSYTELKDLVMEHTDASDRTARYAIGEAVYLKLIYKPEKAKDQKKQPYEVA